MAPLRVICAGVRDQGGSGLSHGESANRGNACSGTTLPFCAGTGPVFHDQTPCIKDDGRALDFVYYLLLS